MRYKLKLANLLFAVVGAVLVTAMAVTVMVTVMAVMLLLIGYLRRRRIKN